MPSVEAFLFPFVLLIPVFSFKKSGAESIHLFFIMALEIDLDLGSKHPLVRFLLVVAAMKNVFQ